MSHAVINVVLDLETLALSEDSAVIQIGAAIPQFDWQHIPRPCATQFTATIRYEEVLGHVALKFFQMDDQTMSWWEKQHSRIHVFSGQDSYEDALFSFGNWLTELRAGLKERKLAVWGNGVDFDNKILAHTYRALNLECPWNFRENMDFRTLKKLFPTTIDQVRDPLLDMEHTALGDARFEARHLNQMWLEHRSLQGVL
jgi:hypothetical protein